MPDYAALVRNTLASVAAPQLDSFNSDIAWTKVTGYGEGSEAVQDPVRGMIDRTAHTAYTDAGTLALIEATLTFVTPLTGVGGRDIFTLPDGFTAPIMKTGGFVDPGTGEAFVTEIKLGNPVRGT